MMAKPGRRQSRICGRLGRQFLRSLAPARRHPLHRVNDSVHRARAAKTALDPKAEGRTNDPERTMADILAVATREFAEKGLAGARIDVIAEAMRTRKRMIYCCFGSK